MHNVFAILTIRKMLVLIGGKGKFIFGLSFKSYQKPFIGHSLQNKEATYACLLLSL